MRLALLANCWPNGQTQLHAALTRRQFKVAGALMDMPGINPNAVGLYRSALRIFNDKLVWPPHTALDIAQGGRKVQFQDPTLNWPLNTDGGW